MGLNYLTEEKLRMKIDEERFRPILITKGRKTGKEHEVMLRAIKYKDKETKYSGSMSKEMFCYSKP